MDKPQSDSLTVAKKSLKLLIALATNKHFYFSPSKNTRQEVYMKPPPYQRVEGYVWKLKSRCMG